MHYSPLGTIATFAALTSLSTAQSTTTKLQPTPTTSTSKTSTTSTSIPTSIADRWPLAIDQGKDQWVIQFPNESPKTYDEVIALSDMTFLNSQLFYQQYFTIHNDIRAEHSASAFTWNVTLAAAAAHHAEECKFEHTANNPYGENLVAGYANMTQSMDAWADERDLYDFANGKFDEKTGHFTQMVWENSTQMGCGRCYCGGGKTETGGDGSDKAPGWFVVCEYSPPGNVEGQYKENVLKGTYVKGAASGLLARGGLAALVAAGVVVALVM